MMQMDTVEIGRSVLSLLIIPTLGLVCRISWVLGRYMQKVDDIEGRVARLEGRERIASGD